MRERYGQRWGLFVRRPRVRTHATVPAPGRFDVGGQRRRAEAPHSAYEWPGLPAGISGDRAIREVLPIQSEPRELNDRTRLTGRTRKLAQPEIAASLGIDRSKSRFSRRVRAPIDGSEPQVGSATALCWLTIKILPHERVTAGLDGATIALAARSKFSTTTYAAADGSHAQTAARPESHGRPRRTAHTPPCRDVGVAASAARRSGWWCTRVHATRSLAPPQR